MNKASHRAVTLQANGVSPFDWAFVLPLLGLVAVLFIRCWRGLDVTDEMQYYGQVLALVESGRLFSTDLFVQQLVYLPFYPLFKAHHLLFGETGLVLFGRLVLALLLLALYFGVRKALLDLGVSRWPAGLAAFAVTFAVPFHGIFALSYNTVSQAGWVLFILWCMVPGTVPVWRWVALIVFVGFAHPVAAIAMTAVLAVWLPRQSEAVEWRRWVLAVLCGLTFSLMVLVSFTSWRELGRALTFSAGFGAGGGALFTDKLAVGSILVYGVAMLSLSKALPRMPRQGSMWLAFVPLMLFMFWVGRKLVREAWSYGYTAPIAQCAGLIAIGCVVLACLRPMTSATPLRALLLVSLVHFLVLVGTSSNGLAQGLGAIMVVVPLACALVAPQAGGGKPWMATALSLMALLLASIHWSKAPYRDWPWYRLDRSFDDVAAFRYLKVSAPNHDLLDAYRRSVGPLMAGRSALIASERPGLYFALGVRPQTCMLYMHSAGEVEAAEALSSCLDERRPEVILNLIGPSDQAPSTLQPIILAQIARLGMSCRNGSLPDHWIHAAHDATSVSHQLCAEAGLEE